MSRSHYTGQLATDDGDYGVHFHRMESGAFAMMDDAQLPMIGSKSTTHLPKPEDDDEFSYDDMSTAHKMNILKQRHELSNLREEAKKEDYRKMTNQMKKLRENERRYYKDASDKAKKKKKEKNEKLKKLVSRVTGKNDESFAQIAIDSLLKEVNNSTTYINDDSSIGETSLGDESLGGSSLSPSIGAESMNSLVSNVSVMPLTIRMSTNVTIARAMDRFNNRKNVFERKHALAENARDVLLHRVHEKKMKPIRLRRIRRREKAITTWVSSIIFLNSAKKLKEKMDSRKEFLAKMAEQNEAATHLQQTLSKARSKKMWAKYVKFYAEVFKSKWIFQMGVRTWRKKKSVDQIKKFLLDNKDRNPMNLMVNKFITKVKKVQRFARHFLACQRQRMNMLGVVWDEIEGKFAKRLEHRMREARKMKPLKVPVHTKVDPKAVKSYNSTCELWEIMDRKMETLLQSERQKKHISRKTTAMHLQKLTKKQKQETLREVLKEQRKWHIKNIEEMKKRLLAERKKRARSKYDVEDVSEVLNLLSMAGKVTKQAEERDIVDRDVPLFLFWTTWGSKAELTKFIEKKYQAKYSEIHGDPIVKWKKKMAEEAKKREKNAAHKIFSAKGNKRRFGVRVMGQSDQLNITFGISTEGLGSDKLNFMNKERNAEVVVSAIRSKQRMKEVENLKARAAVQIERQRRHRVAGLEN